MSYVREIGKLIVDAADTFSENRLTLSEFLHVALLFFVFWWFPWDCPSDAESSAAASHIPSPSLFSIWYYILLVDALNCLIISSIRFIMFFWPCIMNWLYINYQLWCTDYYLFIKYYSPLHISSLKCPSSGGYSCTHAAYGTVTLYESSWWPVGTQLEWELTGGGRLLVGVLRHPTNNLPATVSSHSSCVPTGHQELS